MISQDHGTILYDEIILTRNEAADKTYVSTQVW